MEFSEVNDLREPRPHIRWGWACFGLVCVLITATTLANATGLIDLTGNKVLRAQVEALFDHREQAISEADPVGFLQDVDRTNLEFVVRQLTEFENLTQLPLADFGYTVESGRFNSAAVPESLLGEHRKQVHVMAVTVHYQVTGVDAAPVAAAWLPVVGLVEDTWKIIGEVTEAPEEGGPLPQGTNGQPWDGGTRMSVIGKEESIVLMVPDDDVDLGWWLSELSWEALEAVMELVPEAEDLGVLITVARDPNIEQAHLTYTPERIGTVAGFTVLQYDQVPEWHAEAKAVTSRIIINEDAIAEYPAAKTLLAHELTHAAMNATGQSTGRPPLWLVEGFAEYVALRDAEGDLVATLAGITGGAAAAAGGLPSDERFRSATASDAYVLGWLACRMIAERYGEDRLLALYRAFDGQRDQDTVFSEVLGASTETISRDYAAYAARVAAGQPR